MEDPHERGAPRVARPWQPQYGLGGLMLLMLIASMMAAAGFYYVRARSGQRVYQAVFILMTFMAPLLLAVLLSGLRTVARWWAGR